jgi:uncharacterized repeat protein (TIGR03803 family)
MRDKRFCIRLTDVLTILSVTLLVTTTWAVPREKVLHSFDRRDGVGSAAGLVSDSVGNLYGTRGGGAYNFGTAFELMRTAGGGWTEKVLHDFNLNGRDGVYPNGLIFDAAGNLYGTTLEGGTYGCGTVFELTLAADGGWAEKILHNFRGNNKDGCETWASLIFDATWNLYGTTRVGGAYNYGTVFELTPKGDGDWREKVLHSFNGKDGYYPYASLILDAAGNLYGTTVWGGTYTFGTAFELMPKAGGRWTEKILHSFNGKDGYVPNASLILGAAGNLYGTTVEGGAYNYGTVFGLTRKASGRWTEKVLHDFNFNDTDGFTPYASLILDATGNLYGTTSSGGAYGDGTVFELTRKASGRWTEKVLHSFDFNSRDGSGPSASLIRNATGNLYGTANYGGAHGYGVVFEITP